MEAGVTMTSTTASVSSILDKPLGQLTEEDISQLTREDCRKFLKEKGMRRPSWNKSQAIQQVISLKALLESNDDSGDAAPCKIHVSPPSQSAPLQNAAARVASNSGDSVKEVVFGEEESPYQRKGLPSETAPVGGVNHQGGDADIKNLSPRWCETNELGGQMAIFYCGKVNVYDGVPLDKDNICGANAALRSFVCHVQAEGDENGLVASTALNSLSMQTEKMTEYQQQFRKERNINRDSDGQVNRKVSLQRYLEKRKDRGRFFKGRKNTGQTPASLEMYLNNQIRTHNSNGQSSQSSAGSSPQSGLPHAFCSSADNQAKLMNLSVDLNDKKTRFLNGTSFTILWSILHSAKLGAMFGNFLFLMLGSLLGLRRNSLNFNVEFELLSPNTHSSPMAIEAWFMDDSKEDQRLPHQRYPNEPVSLDHLAELGVLYWHLNPKDYENDEELKKIREARGYNYTLLVRLCNDYNIVSMKGKNNERIQFCTQFKYEANCKLQHRQKRIRICLIYAQRKSLTMRRS
ncbi:hypothetical protein DITRI_Ditri15bG0084000 [Diplodiscus trichospermus]